MRATDENGLAFEVFQCGVDCVRDIYWNVYLLKERDGETETYSAAPIAIGTLHDIITIERCDCEGDHDPAPGAAIYDGDDVQRCNDCERFYDDADAVSAYAAGLNRAVGHEHFVPIYEGDRQRIALASSPLKTLNEEQIDVELDRLHI